MYKSVMYNASVLLTEVKNVEAAQGRENLGWTGTKKKGEEVCEGPPKHSNASACSQLKRRVRKPAPGTVNTYSEHGTKPAEDSPESEVVRRVEIVGRWPRPREEMPRFSLFFWALLREVLLLRGELWEEDLTSAMTIGLSTTGYKSVDLRCDSSHFSVNVTLEDDFQGVVYTRGSFSDKKLPCFKSHHQNSLKKDNRLLMSLRIPFHACRTVMDVAESRYTNTLVVQHDPDLIMPGDAAFLLNCAFVPEFKVNSDLDLKEPPFRSRITLVDADPSGEKTNSDKRNITVLSNGDEVTFVPPSEKTKDEL